MNFINPTHYKSLSIPKEIRKDIKTALDRNEGKISYNYQDLTFLFEVYNRYIAFEDEPEDMGCSHCRTLVIGKLKQYVQQWEQHGYEG